MRLLVNNRKGVECYFAAIFANVSGIVANRGSWLQVNSSKRHDQIGIAELKTGTDPSYLVNETMGALWKYQSVIPTKYPSLFICLKKVEPNKFFIS